jgi:hypothetical protein
MGRRRLVGEKIFTAPSQGGDEQEEETEDVATCITIVFSVIFIYLSFSSHFCSEAGFLYVWKVVVYRGKNHVYYL